MYSSEFQLVAHRGYMESQPENTWQGIEAALNLGAEWVECDVQMFQPDKFVLLHDADFNRTANSPISVFNLDEYDLHSISVHEPGRLGNRFFPQPVPLLESVLEKLENYPYARLMVEIKEESLEHWGVERVMKPLVDLIANFSSQVVLISFSLQALQYIKQQFQTDIEFGWVLRRYDGNSLLKAHELAPHYLICNWEKMDQENIPEPGPWRWMLYDLTDPELARQWISKGVSLIETRDIERMMKALPLGRHTRPHNTL